MALNIPNVAPFSDTLLKGIDTGSAMFSRLMQPIVEREKQKQLEAHFQQKFALDKANASRLAQAASDAHKLTLMKLDPTYDAKRFEALENYYRNKGSSSGKTTEKQNYPDLHKLFAGQGAFNEGVLGQGNIDLNNRPEVSNPETGGTSTIYSMSIGTPQGEVLIPRVSDDGRILSEPEAIDQFHKTGKHLGIYSSPEEANLAAQAIHEQQAKMIAPKSNNGIDLELMKQHPMLRGWYKKHFGIDPLAQSPQTPAEKQAANLDLFKQKLALKGGTTPTNAVLTQNQKAIQGIDAALPVLDELINSKDLPGIFTFSPGQKARYLSKTGSIIDTLVAAQNLPQVQASIDLVEQQIRRHTGETIYDYQQRLKDFKKDLLARRERAVKNVTNGKISTNPPETTNSLIEGTTKKLNGKTYKVIKGVWHEIK